MISIIIPVHNCYEYTLDCLMSIRECTREEHEIIIVDNGSTDKTADLCCAPDPGYDRYFRNEENLGFPRAVNQGAAAARGDFLCVLNNDVIVTPEWIERLSFHIRELGAQIVGPCSNYVAGAQRVQIPIYENREELSARAELHYQKNRHISQRVNWIIGLCMLLPAGLFHLLGGFDEQFGLGNSEDIDFCLKARKAGHEVAIARDVYIHHFGGITHKELRLDYAGLLKENHEKLIKKWGEDHESLNQEIRDAK